MGRGRSFADCRAFLRGKEGRLEEITAYLHAVGNDSVKIEKLMMQKSRYKINLMKNSKYS